MRISVNNRHRIVLLLFVVLDHLVWLYAGHWEQVSFAYVVMTECFRVFVGIALVASFFYKKILEITINFILSYCAIMMLLSFIGSSSDGMSFVSEPGATPNVLFFKKLYETGNRPLREWFSPLPPSVIETMRAW